MVIQKIERSIGQSFHKCEMKGKLKLAQISVSKVRVEIFAQRVSVRIHSVNEKLQQSIKQ